MRTSTWPIGTLGILSGDVKVLIPLLSDFREDLQKIQKTLYPER